MTVTLSAKESLILGENKAAFRREGHYNIVYNIISFLPKSELNILY